MEQTRTLLRQCFLGTCEAYEIPLNQEIDSHTASIIQSIIVRGTLIGAVGLCVLLAGYVKPFRMFQKFFLPKLAIVAPMLIGVVGGGFVGFGVSFSACFKKSCSGFEQSAVFIIPLLGLLVALPIAYVIFRKRLVMAAAIERSGRLVWIIVGGLMITYAIASTLFRLG